MAEEKKDEKKIIVDEDWKQQAEKEKEKLVAEEETKKQQEGSHRGPLPPGDFTGLVSMLFTQTLFSLGIIQAKGEEKQPPNLGLAKYNIDLLEMLEGKTKGNLSEDEQKLLANTLDELRMAYVKVSDMADKQQKE